MERIGKGYNKGNKRYSKGRVKMEEEIVKELCKKYNKKEELINVLIKIGLECEFTLEEIKKYIELFYNK